MSKVRGILPLFLATAIGIGNGLWVFGPALKEQKEKEEQAKKTIETIQTASNIEEVRDAEAAASRASATEQALKPIQPSASWWPKSIVWSQEGNGTTIKPVTRASDESTGQTQEKSTKGP